MLIRGSMQDFQGWKRLMKVVNTRGSDLRLADVEPPQEPQTLQGSQAGVGNFRVAEFEPLEMRQPLGQVLQPSVSHSRVEEIEGGEGLQSTEVCQSRIADAGVVKMQGLEIWKDKAAEGLEVVIGDLGTGEVDGDNLALIVAPSFCNWAVVLSCSSLREFSVSRIRFNSCSLDSSWRIGSSYLFPVACWANTPRLAAHVPTARRLAPIILTRE